MRNIASMARWAASAALLGALAGPGCSSIPARPDELFRASAPDLPRPLRDIFLESLRVVVLLEDLREGFEREDIRAYGACFSPRFSYYEQGWAWWREKVEREYFRPYAELRLDFETVDIALFKQDAYFWIRQEGYDWLGGEAGRRPFRRDYRMLIASPWGDADVLFGPSPARTGKASREENSPRIPVAVTCRVDPELDVTMAEVTVRGTVRGASPGGGFEMRQEQILLLEKDAGRWSIVSVR
ncbi:MAG TPA: hypothetical protein PLZ73_02375 [bacterium]|nr:hypothetical protein [bacterium]